MTEPIRVYENVDDLDKAIEGLAQFCHNFCMNVEETEKKQDLVFRCKECEFRLDKKYCAVKMFLANHGTPEQINTGTCMGGL